MEVRDSAAARGPHLTAREDALTASAALIAALREPRCYPHAVSHLEVVETHASWVMLTGGHAYKIKKPVALGFLDYSTLEKRRRACQEEYRLNRMLAPDLYLEVVPITGSVPAPVVNGAGTAIEYALHMREFDRSQQFDRLLEAGRLDERAMDELADYIATFHLNTPRLEPSAPYAHPEDIHRAALDNFMTLQPLFADRYAAELGRLHVWSETTYRQQRALMDQRIAQGWVREGHGDLHLANLTRYHGRVMAFDRIEFDPGLRWLDVINDTAFLVMDLLYRERRDLAFRFLNGYLQHTGDYRGLPLLRYYLVYRALVRAKVALIRRSQLQNGAQRETLARRAGRHIELADALLIHSPPRLVLMHGLSGSGKTWMSGKLMTRLPAIRLRSDVERKRLYGVAPQQPSGSGLGTDMYAEAVNRRTYNELASLAQTLLAVGYSVIVDAAFLRHWQRYLFVELCARLGVDWVIVHSEVPAATLRRRLQGRARRGNEVSEAHASVLDYQRRVIEPLDDNERRHALRVDADGTFDADAISAALPTLPLN
jgi:aminoglycoside phosphotransferase family enzyme/predicted kinase